MLQSIANLVPEQWQSLFEFLTGPISWIPEMQQSILSFVFTSSSGWLAVVYYLLLLFPVMLWIGAVWCTQLSIYTLPFRSGRVEFAKLMLLAWWDAALAVWMYWVGLARFVVVVAGWAFTMARLALKLIAETGRQVVMLPFTMTGQMTRSYFQPGVPWIAFLLVVFWCLLEAVIFTYTLFPTVSEVLAGIVGAEASPYTGSVLFVFLFLLIMGSFACLQVLADAVKNREYKFLVQMILVELFVMTFEVMFLYRELVDAITPWIAQQTGEKIRLGILFTLSLATFGWVGVRGMTWFLFGQYGTPPLLAFISRRPMVQPEAEAGKVTAPTEMQSWWRATIEELKHEIAWLHEKGNELMEYLALPFIHVVAAALNFAMILVTARPVFSIPFKSLNEVLQAREILPTVRLQPKKVSP
ncbi:MAG: hypothetical protein HY581_08535 [Nitrospirae bacterium]|nr:hypothetical protein [Nitrospirota bacterium]